MKISPKKSPFKSLNKHSYNKNFQLLDKFGLSVSLLCLAHCILVPILLLLLPSYSLLLGSWHGHVHIYLYFIILPLSLIAFIPRAVVDKQWEFLWGPGCAVLVLGMTMYLHSLNQLPFAHIAEPLLTSIASFALIYFHWRNFTLRNHKCPKC